MNLRKPLLVLTVTALLMLAWGRAARAAVLSVPAQFPTIQGAVNAAVDGDTVQVASGTYAESVVWSTKQIQLLGQGADTTILDPSGGPGGRCLTITNVPRGAVVAGFTCQNGVATSGGGMLASNSDLTVEHFVFTRDSSPAGGGMRSEGGSPTLIDVTFRSNSTAPHGVGAGMSIAGGSPNLVDVVFANNVAAAGIGGGLDAFTADVTLEHCTFQGNLAIEASGGGISARSSHVSLQSSTFDGNGASVVGGAILSSGSTLEAKSTTFTRNSASDASGGAIFGSDGTAILEEATFQGNASGFGGGAIDGFDNLVVIFSNFDSNRTLDRFGGAIETGGALTLTSDTFTNNIAARTGGAVYASGNATIFRGVFEGNQVSAQGLGGGGVAVTGTASIIDTSFHANTAPLTRGGGLLVTGTGASATVIESTFIDNVASAGGGLAVDTGASATVLLSIFCGNQVGDIDAAGAITVIDSTVGGPSCNVCPTVTLLVATGAAAKGPSNFAGPCAADPNARLDQYGSDVDAPSDLGGQCQSFCDQNNRQGFEACGVGWRLDNATAADLFSSFTPLDTAPLQRAELREDLGQSSANDQRVTCINREDSGEHQWLAICTCP